MNTNNKSNINTYTPKSWADIYANKNVCQSLRNWNIKSNDGKKLVLISGRSGIGKTCYINFICAIEGFTIV